MKRRIIARYLSRSSRLMTTTFPIFVFSVCLGFCFDWSVPFIAAAGCTDSSYLAFRSCKRQVAADFWLARGKCVYSDSEDDISNCLADSMTEKREEMRLCGGQYQARLDLCNELGEDPYVVTVNPANFEVTVDNAYFPLVPGTKYVYKSQTENGLGRIEVQVTDEKKEILGVACTVVRDTVYVNNEIREDTYDWYAQDKQGNVWYFGESSLTYQEGSPVSTEGSWKAGTEGAQPGIIMLAHPSVGFLYRQEFLLGEAEDLAQILALDSSAPVPGGNYTNCLKTRDFSSLEPGLSEDKYYAPGLGMVLEINPVSGERSELIDIIRD